MDPHAYLLLDVVRYLACVSVFVGHFLFIFIVRIYGLDRTFYHPNVVVSAGYFFSHAIAVMVFFVMSGFLIGSQVFSEVHATQRFDVWAYLKKRILRIVPPLYFAVVLTLIVCVVIRGLHLFGSESYFLTDDLYVLTPKASLTVLEVLKVLLLVPGDTELNMDMALWSLSYEFYYYALFAMVFVVYVNKSRKQLMCLSGYVLLLPLLFMCLNHQYIVMYLKVWALGLVWLWGVGIAYVYLTHKRVLSPRLSLIISGLVFIGIYPFAWHLGDVGVELCGGVVAGFLMLFLVNFKFKKTPPRILRTLARGSFYTYTLYLVHFPLMLLAFSLLGTRILTFNWVDFTILFLVLFVVINVLSCYLARALENRDFWLKLFRWQKKSSS
jgi:peptidoglycan/LPS O-acetylase OafA/YrhL